MAGAGQAWSAGEQTRLRGEAAVLLAERRCVEAAVKVQAALRPGFSTSFDVIGSSEDCHYQLYQLEQGPT